MASGSSSIPHKSKKHSGSAAEIPTQNPFGPKTPQKPSELLSARVRNRGVALSPDDVRRVAESLRKSNRAPHVTESGSSRRRILFSESSVSVQKPNVYVKAARSTELPEKYQALIEYFNALDNSIRLSKQRGLMTAFKDICPMVETLTQRSFTYQELSQLKYILPEAIRLTKMMASDEKTSCLHISLNADAIEIKGKPELRSTYMRKIFRRRLVDFIKTHPQGEDVPEAPLPEPFNHIQLGRHEKKILCSSDSPLPAEIASENGRNLQSARASHISRNTATPLAEKYNHVAAEVSAESSASLVQESNSMVTPTKKNCKIESSFIRLVQGEPSLMATPIKETCNRESTPPRHASTLAWSIVETPPLHPPKRSYISPKDDSESSPSKLIRRPSCSRTLKFDTPPMSIAYERMSDDDLDVLSESLLQSIKEKVKKAIEETDPAISLAKSRRKLITSRLPNRFDTIRHLFQTSNRTVMKKEDLVDQIITGSPDRNRIDSREAEEELELLIELVPEWITEELASTGDLIVRIKKAPDADAIRARLKEAQ